LIQKYEKSLGLGLEIKSCLGLGLENYGGLGLEIQSLGLGFDKKVLFTSLVVRQVKQK